MATQASSTFITSSFPFSSSTHTPSFPSPSTLPLASASLSSSYFAFDSFRAKHTNSLVTTTFRITTFSSSFSPFIVPSPFQRRSPLPAHDLHLCTFALNHQSLDTATFRTSTFPPSSSFLASFTTSTSAFA